MKHLTCWPIVKSTKRYTADVVVEFLKTKFLQFSALAGINVSNNGSFFTAGMFDTFLREQGTLWWTVLAYTPMSSGRAGRIVGTMKRSIGKVVNETIHALDSVLFNVLFGYL